MGENTFLEEESSSMRTSGGSEVVEVKESSEVLASDVDGSSLSPSEENVKSSLLCYLTALN